MPGAIGPVPQAVTITIIFVRHCIQFSRECALLCGCHARDKAAVASMPIVYGCAPSKRLAPTSRPRPQPAPAHATQCTFEAANVAQRRLPVAVAGAGMSGFQRQVQRFGSFTPAFTADGTLDELAKLNLCAYMGVLGPIVLAATSTVDGKADHCYSVSFADEQCIYQYESAAIAMFLWLLWLAGRAALASQVRLAKNARVVLRTMSLAGSPRRAQHSSANKLLRSPTLETASDRQVDVAPHAVFLRELPWLPTHDHRDVLVVQELLARSCPDLQPCPQAVRALALSAYIAARQRPAAGDATAGSLSLRAWLSERGIRLVPAGELTGLTWFDGVECSTAPEQDGLPLRALKDLGWIIARGMRCSLLTPLGVIEVASPMESKWTLVNAAFLHRHHPGVGKAVAGLLATTGLVAILISVLQVLLASHPSENRMLLHSSPPYAASATACFVLPLPFCALLLQQLWQTDFTVVRNGHMPLPFAVFDHPLKTLIAAVACAAACSVEVCFAWIDSKQIAGATGWAVAGHAVRTTVETLLSVALLYEFMLITVHLMVTSSPVIISLCQRLCGKPSTDWAARDGILC
jgi:hypothetical protein